MLAVGTVVGVGGDDAPRINGGIGCAGVNATVTRTAVVTGVESVLGEIGNAVIAPTTEPAPEVGSEIDKGDNDVSWVVASDLGMVIGGVVSAVGSNVGISIEGVAERNVAVGCATGTTSTADPGVGSTVGSDVVEVGFDDAPDRNGSVDCATGTTSTADPGVGSTVGSDVVGEGVGDTSDRNGSVDCAAGTASTADPGVGSTAGTIVGVDVVTFCISNELPPYKSALVSE